MYSIFHLLLPHKCGSVHFCFHWLLSFHRWLCTQSVGTFELSCMWGKWGRDEAFCVGGVKLGDEVDGHIVNELQAPPTTCWKFRLFDREIFTSSDIRLYRLFVFLWPSFFSDFISVFVESRKNKPVMKRCKFCIVRLSPTAET